MTLPAGQVERQPILLERIERYAKARRIASLDDAIERLVRIGLFTEAAPDGALLIRRGNLPEWRVSPAPRNPVEPVDSDPAF